MSEQNSVISAEDKAQDILSLEKASIMREKNSSVKHKKTDNKKAAQNGTAKTNPKRRRRRILITLSSVIGAVVCLYLVVVFSNIPFIAYWRGIWIETAMTTGKHHWLATAFFPKNTIDEVMKNYTTNSGIVGGNDLLIMNDETKDTRDTDNEKDEPVKEQRPEDILGQKELSVGDKDYAGNTILVNDIEEGLIISEIVRGSFRGQIMLIDDPSRVFVGQTQYQNNTGMRILDMMEVYGAVAGINASGFNDPAGNGNGGTIVGLSCSEGNYWGNYLSGYSSIVLTTDDKLVVGDIGSWDQYNIRDGIQFYPVLIADGVQQVTGSAGYGLQPRTAVGQREDGVIAFLIIDGRDVTWSVGCTVGDLAEILMDYDIVNASCCDGGASSCLAYNGKITTKNCSWNPSIGRILPNAFMVKSKKAG
ncbi:MAG: phosphodiester glycosidase family protein [Clostridia bacterium]|nr:phosphodiester glycosidase family protein [Clostridia bacterium]